MTLLTVEEAATFLRLKPSTLYKHREIPRTRIPGIRAVLYDQDDLIKWLKGQHTPSPIAATGPPNNLGIDTAGRITYTAPSWLQSLTPKGG